MSAMTVIDLTKPIQAGMPVYPGDPEVQIQQVYSLKEDGYTVHRIEMSDQAGTHVETQYHMVAGKKLEDEPLDRFIGTAAVVDVPCRKILVADFQDYDQTVKECDFLLLRSGYNDKVASIKPSDVSRPILAMEAAEWIASRGVRLVGIDCFDFDRGPDYKVHLFLFEHNVLIVEGLVNLGSLNARVVKLFVIPLRIEGTAASPCRVFAIAE